MDDMPKKPIEGLIITIVMAALTVVGAILSAAGVTIPEAVASTLVLTVPTLVGATVGLVLLILERRQHAIWAGCVAKAESKGEG